MKELDEYSIPVLRINKRGAPQPSERVDMRRLISEDGALVV